ncbi:hypothetical protein XCR1_100010 [Xenorhabdus cabanillasii JM26]|uniref:Uncharacterized protein n=1 Tax=Xenorhabdus cabanillasii JM26 TaxID=1427517 RepID=W1IMV9_9GAMM|nr:hypothetical protein XCR1_100010 [Xenorhabdus cabanillasii JM26]
MKGEGRFPNGTVRAHMVLRYGVEMSTAVVELQYYLVFFGIG